MYDAPAVKPFALRIALAVALVAAASASAVARSQTAASQKPASITATPNPVPTGTGHGTTTISWSTGSATEGEVRVSIDGAPERLFARGKSGSVVADWIQDGVTYDFGLYVTPAVIPIASVRVSRAVPPPGAAGISASPNPVPANAGARTTISWTTGSRVDGRVKVSTDNGLEQTVAQGPSGTIAVDWIRSGSVYEFRLYTGSLPATLVAKITVTRASTSSLPNTPPAVTIAQTDATEAGRAHVRVNWTTGDRSDGVVYVSKDGGPGEAFAHGATGSIVADWIRETSGYEFRLYSVASRAFLASAKLPASATAAVITTVGDGLSAKNVGTIRARSFLKARPNPVPLGWGSGDTEISWRLDALRQGQVMVVVDGGEEIPLATGSGGTAELSIKRGSTYELRLYGGEPRVLILSAMVIQTTSTPGLTPAGVGVLVLILAVIRRRRRARRRLSSSTA